MEMSTDSVRDLIKEKDEIEANISLELKILETNRNIGMDGPLIDKQGYPRSDIDIYQVRKARNKIICLRNDHKALMKEIEKQLYSIHAEAKEKGTVAVQVQPDPSEVQPKTFACVTMVTNGSPAHNAGLKVGDKLIEFGSVTNDNFTDMTNISTVVQHSVMRSVRLVVLRDGKSIAISLVPQQWNGRGLLGCVISPI